MTKAQSDLLSAVKKIMDEEHTYIYFEISQLKSYITESSNGMTPEQAADYFRDYLLSSGECDVVE
jgi:hypothetical protein